MFRFAPSPFACQFTSQFSIRLRATWFLYLLKACSHLNYDRIKSVMTQFLFFSLSIVCTRAHAIFHVRFPFSVFRFFFFFVWFLRSTFLVVIFSAIREMNFMFTCRIKVKEGQTLRYRSTFFTPYKNIFLLVRRNIRN